MAVLPEVTVTIKQNSLGLQDPSAGDALAIVGPSSAGPTIDGVADAYNKPLLYGSTNAAKTDYVSGALVEAAAVGLEVTGRPVVLVRTEATTAGEMTDIDTGDITGTAVPVATDGQEPVDDFEPYVIVRAGGTVGTTGITYQWSLDGGRHFSPLAALGTATKIDLGSGVSFDLDPSTAAKTALVTLVNEIRTDFLAHIVLTSGSVHAAADSTSDDGVGSAASTAADALTLVNTLRTAAIAHAANTTAHTLADSTSFASLPAAAVTIADAVTLANALKAAYNAHRVKTSGSVHGAADNTNATSAADVSQGTLAAGDFWTARTKMPASTEAELDAALAALQASGYTFKTILILPPVLTTSNASAIATRFNSMVAAYKFKKIFGTFRYPDVGETESAYLAAFKAQFDSITCYGLSLSAGAVEFQSAATKPRTYKRPPSWLAAAEHVQRGPSTSIAYVENGLGALPLAATIKDANGNAKHHDESLDPGLDAARAITVRSLPGYPGKCFFTRDRTMAQLATDFMYIHFWAAMVEVLDVAVPHFIGQIQDNIVPDPDTGRILGSFARELEKGAEEEIDASVTARGHIVRATCSVDRTVNVYTTPQLPVTISVIPIPVNDGFALTVALNNPQYNNA